MPGETAGILSQGGKCALGDVLGQMCIAKAAQRGGIDEINMAADEFRKGGIRAVVRVILQELLVRAIVHS